VVHAEHVASLTLGQASDAHRARALCAHYGVVLALDAGGECTAPSKGPVLWLNPGAALATCQRVQPGGSAWFVQPGCLLGDVAAAGLPGFERLPAHVSVAAWLADRSLCPWATGATARSGVAHAAVLLADGSRTVLGPFGAGQHAPLASATQRRLVSGLFALAASAAAQRCLAETQWPARYRLDALRPGTGAEANLAQVLCGHGGALAWVEWLVLDERGLAQDQHVSDASGYGQQANANAAASASRVKPAASDPVLRCAAQSLDAQVKTLFDPDGLFGSAYPI